MSPAEIALVLTKCASYDRRTIGRADVAAWHEAIGDLPFQPALDAVAAHHGHSVEWCRPAHIRHIVEAARHSLPSDRPLRDAIAEIAVPFDEVANRRGIAAAREAMANRKQGAAQ